MVRSSRRVWSKPFTVIGVVLMSLAVGAGVYLAAWPVPSPARLDVNFRQPEGGYVIQLGHHEVRLVLERFRGAGDKGRATVVVWVNGLEFRRLHSSYNYDLWTDEPAGLYWRTWVDSDPHPDLRLTLNDWGQPKEYWIRGLDGQVLPYVKAGP